MTTNLTAKPGFPWHALRWDDAEAQVGVRCSLCEDPIEDDACPLRLWNGRGDSAVFCDQCAERWLDLKRYEE
jgi:hypothetical protein